MKTPKLNAAAYRLTLKVVLTLIISTAFLFAEPERASMHSISERTEVNKSSEAAPMPRATPPRPTRKPSARSERANGVQKRELSQTGLIGAINGRIAYHNFYPGNRLIQSVDPDGSDPLQLSVIFGDAEPSYSTDGSKIVFSTNRDRATNNYYNDYEIYEMNADGTDQRRLTNNLFSDRDPVFSPDGTKLVFISQRDGDQSDEIYRMNADGTGQTRLTDNLDSESHPEFSRDGSKVIFERSGDIYTINVDGTGETLLIDVFEDLHSPSFSPDGTQVVVSGRDFSDMPHIWIANADGTGLQPVVATNGLDDNEPAWSPDGTQIVYTDEISGISNLKIYNVALNTTTSVTQYSDSQYLGHPTWRPLGIGCTGISAGLVAWWRGENFNANETPDSSGNGHSGTRSGVVTLEAGKIGHAYNFATLDDTVIAVPDNDTLDVVGGDFSIDAWIFPRDGSRHQFIAGKDAGANSYYLTIESGGTIRFSLLDDVGVPLIVEVANGLNFNDWNHITVVRSGTDLYLYTDIAANGVGGVITTDPLTNNSPFTIGRAPNVGFNSGFDGRVDELRVWDRALSSQEISDIVSADLDRRICVKPIRIVQNYPNPVSAGRTTSATVHLDHYAPSGGVVVDLSVYQAPPAGLALDPLPIVIPSTVTIPEFQSSVQIPIQAELSDQWRSADIIATWNGQNARSTVSIAPSAPDLTVSTFVAPAAVDINTYWTGTWTDTNIGQAPTSAVYWDDCVYVSPDDQYGNGNDSFVGCGYNDGTPLVVNATRNFSSQYLTIPASAIPVSGDYYLIVFVNHNFAVNEREQYFVNNYQVRPIHVNRRFPDYVAQNVIVPAEVEPLTSFDITWTTQNIGDQDALPNSQNRVYLSTDGSLSADDTLLSANNMPPLPAGQGEPFTLAYSLPTLPIRPTGNYFICVQVDATAFVVEDDSNSGPGETNNVTCQQFHFNYRVADLQVTAGSTPPDPETDTPIAVSWTDTNAGNRDATAYWDRVYFSPDNVINGNDVYLGDFLVTDGLAQGQSINRIQNVTIPTNSISATGDYYLYVYADLYGNIDEGQNENNNARFVPIRLHRFQRPDLQVTNVTSPSTAFFDQSIQIQWTVTNNGPGPTNANQWTDNVYLSTTQTGGSVMLSPTNVSSLNIGESYITTATFRIPRGNNGSYYVVVQTDAGNQVNEENETNNVNSHPITINVPPVPDLRTSNVQAPGSGFAGQPISVSWTVTNNGTGATFPGEVSWNDLVYISHDAIFDGGDTYLGVRPHTGALAQNASYSVTNFSVNLPFNIIGPYYVFVVTDGYSQVFEYTSEGNNADYDRVQPGSPMNVIAAPPDLVITSPITAVSVADASATINAAFTVKNQGAFDAVGGWYDAVYLSTDQTFSVDDTIVGWSPHTGLAAGSQYDASFAVRVPSCISGAYYLIAVTDFNNQVFEYDPNFNAEANNTSAAKAVQINTSFPDLSVANVSAGTSTITSGQPLQVNWTVTNNGTAPTASGSFLDRVYLGDSPGALQFQVGQFLSPSGLAVGASYNQSQSVTVPATIQGTYYITVYTDIGSSIPECSAENNNTSGSISINVLNSLPDLRITDISAPNSAVLGSTINVSWNGKNLGQPMSSASWADRIYLSTGNSFPYGSQPLGGTVITAALGTNETYARSAQAVIPNVAPGSYYLFVYTDAAGNIIEGIENGQSELNNWLAVPITLTAPGVDLRASAVSVPAPTYAGISTDVSWTVTNNGDTPTLSAAWTDYVILSRDSVYDNTDRIIGYKTHYGALNGATSYNETSSVYIPAGLTGDYNIFVYTDLGNNVIESIENNNLSAPLAVNLQLPPPADLNITNITVPGNAAPGELATFTWTVQNSGVNQALGLWQDTVYLSTDNTWDVSDTIVATQTHSGPIAPSTTYTETINAAIPSVDTGTYFVIVRTDARNSVRESNETNNLASSILTTNIAVQTLTLGVPFNTSLVTDQQRFYKYELPIDETLLVTLAGQTGASNELFSRFGSMVNRANYEVQGNRQREANQENVVDHTNAGTYYSMIRGDYVPNSFTGRLHAAPKSQIDDVKTKVNSPQAENVTIKAEIVPFSVRRVSPVKAGNQGFTIISVEGAKFQEGATMKLVGPGNTEIAALNNYFHSQAKVAALFDLNQKTAGNYQVVVTNPNSQTATSTQLFQIRNGGGGPRMRTEIYGPGGLRAGGTYRFVIAASNEGSNDALTVPIIIVLPGVMEYHLSNSNYIPNVDDPDYDPMATNSFHCDRDGKRIIALYAPIVRADEKVEIAIDIKVNVGGQIIANAMNPLFNTGMYPPGTPGAELMRPTVTGSAVINCWTHLFLKSLLTILGEIFPTECALEIVSSIAGLAEDAVGYVRTGSFDGYAAMVSLFSKAIKSTVVCVKKLLGYLPWVKVAAILYDIWQILNQTVECGSLSLDYFFPITFNASLDPNEKIGPIGWGPEKFVGIQQPLSYRINFENVATATGPAQRIRVVDQLPPGVDPHTVRLLEIRFKQYKIEVPPNRAFYQGRLQLGADLNNLVADVSAGLDISTGKVTWDLTAIDPATGEQTLNAFQGILPPNNAAHDGEGYVTFLIQPATDAPTRTNIANQATIYFDDNEPIPTNTTSNLLDADIPGSIVGALSATQSTPTFPLNWSGSDDANGSGLKGFDIYYTENGGPLTQFVTDSPATVGTFTGRWGKSYTFYSRAKDNAGNIEAAPLIPDATTSVVGGISESDVYPRPNGDNNGAVDGADVGQVRRFVAKLDSDFLVNEFQRTDAAPRIDGGNGILSVCDIVQSRRYADGLDSIIDSGGPNTAVALISNAITGKSGNLLLREVKPVRVTLLGNAIRIAVELESQGDETGAGFTLNFDPTHLTNPQYVTLGAGAAGGNLTVNMSESSLGRIGLIVDKPPDQPFAAGARQLVTIDFTVVNGAPSTTNIGFVVAPVVNEVSDGFANSLATTFTTAPISLTGPTASSVTISGKVTRPDGRPIASSKVTLTSGSGEKRTAITNPFGHYRFDDVESGATYILTVSHKQILFANPARVITVNDSVTDADFVSQE